MPEITVRVIYHGIRELPRFEYHKWGSLPGDRGVDRWYRMPDAEMDKITSKLIYVGDTLSFVQLAKLYQAADAYVSPYLAEGFNLPVLEAAACGLPVGES